MHCSRSLCINHNLGTMLCKKFLKKIQDVLCNHEAIPKHLYDLTELLEDTLQLIKQDIIDFKFKPLCNSQTL